MEYDIFYISESLTIITKILGAHIRNIAKLLPLIKRFLDEKHVFKLFEFMCMASNKDVLI